jgi:hypothetical protein
LLLAPFASSALVADKSFLEPLLLRQKKKRQPRWQKWNLELWRAATFLQPAAPLKRFWQTTPA